MAETYFTIRRLRLCLVCSCDIWVWRGDGGGSRAVADVDEKFPLSGLPVFEVDEDELDVARLRTRLLQSVELVDKQPSSSLSSSAQ